MCLTAVVGRLMDLLMQQPWILSPSWRVLCSSPSTDLVCRAKGLYAIHVEPVLGSWSKVSPLGATSRDWSSPNLSALEVIMVSNETALACM